MSQLKLYEPLQTANDPMSYAISVDYDQSSPLDCSELFAETCLCVYLG